MAVPLFSNAQDAESTEVQMYGKRYINIRLHRLERFESQQKRRQERLVARLSRKERRIKALLLGKDSTVWQRYNAQAFGFDSIAHLVQRDSASASIHYLRRSNVRLDSLRGIAQYLSTATAVTGEARQQDVYSSRISALQSRLQYRKLIDEMIARRMTGLSFLGPDKIPAVRGMQKEFYYAKAQIKSFQALADEPGRLEAKAYEFLQGQLGFEETVDGAVNSANPLFANSGTADLKRLGYQTQQQVGASLQQKLGTNVNTIQKQLGTQLNEWKGKVSEASEQVKSTKETLFAIRHTQSASFKVNPMRCLPFRERIEKSYDFQTTRPTTDGKPAMLQVGGMIAYRQSPSIKAGIGLASSIGLGQSWSEIHFSSQAITLRAFISGQIKWGIRCYVGYERSYFATNQALRLDGSTQLMTSRHSTEQYDESLLLGLTKPFVTKGKQHSEIQFFYDAWWRDKALNSPFVIRVSNGF